MSLQSDPVSEQKVTIGSELNGTVLQGLFLGIYTVVYLGTLILYLNKKSSGSRLVVGAISLLYFLYSFYVILFWYLVQSAFTEHSDTRATLYEAILGGSEWPIFITGIITFTMPAVGDAILIWRCFTIWGGSLRVASLPAVLLFGQIAVDLTVIILRSVENFNPTYSQSIVTNDLIAAQSFLTFATTLSSTVLIAYRIYSTSKENIFGTTRKRLWKITEILVESAALYSLAAVAQAVALVVPETLSNEIAVALASAYTSILFLFISGVTPTVLVARIAILEYTNNDTVIGASAPLSGLHFQKQFTKQDESLSITSRGWNSRDSTLHSADAC